MIQIDPTPAADQLFITIFLIGIPFLVALLGESMDCGVFWGLLTFFYIASETGIPYLVSLMIVVTVGLAYANSSFIMRYVFGSAGGGQL